MVKPEKKLKKILLIMGITGAVYGGFRYLLPLVIPFLLAYGTALWLRPSARFFAKRLKFSFRKREYHVPVWFAGGAELIAFLMGLGGLFYLVGSLLASQVRLFIARFPGWLLKLDSRLTDVCLRLEQKFGFTDRYLVEAAGDAVEEILAILRTATMPALMSNSLAAAGKAARALVFLFIYVMAVILCLQEMEDIRERRSNSAFHREFALLSGRLSAVGNAWIKTQFILLILTSALCIFGLFLIGNPYCVLFGLGIGILDALPIFGAGAVLIPWFILLFAGGQWGKGAVILSLYLACYFLRQFTEAKVMGSKVGLSALETLISMYVGLELFGLSGFLLGPVGLLIIQDLTEAYGAESH